MGNTGLRPDEIGPKNLLHRDVTIVTDRISGQRILEIEVRGKRGVGYGVVIAVINVPVLYVKLDCMPMALVKELSRPELS
jgi:hypothetical protein